MEEHARGHPAPVRGERFELKVCTARVIGRWGARVMGACVRVRIGRVRGGLCAG